MDLDTPCQDWLRVSPLEGTGDQWKYFGMEIGVPQWERTWDQWKYYWMEILCDGDGGDPPHKCEQTDTCENSTFLILRMPAVNIEIGLRP